jgi:hypothetical protein
MTPLAQKILREVYNLSDDEYPLTWTPMTLAHRFAVETGAAAEAIRWLICAEYLTIDEHGHYWCTTLGWQALERAAAHPAVTSSSKNSQWKNEALSGMDAKGHKSDIDRAVLPTGQQPRPAPVDVQVAQRRKLLSSVKVVCEETGLSMEEVASLMADGFVKVCRICGDLEKHGKKGEYTQPLCLKCDARRQAEKRRGK